LTQQEIDYLRRKAEQFREVAAYHTPISLKLFEIAEELERVAGELEKRRRWRKQSVDGEKWSMG
jgi:hypothetical protein